MLKFTFKKSFQFKFFKKGKKIFHEYDIQNAYKGSFIAFISVYHTGFGDRFSSFGFNRYFAEQWGLTLLPECCLPVWSV
jgi:hypothetical protein